MIPNLGGLLSEGAEVAAYNKILSESEVLKNREIIFTDGEPNEIDKEVLGVYRLGHEAASKIYAEYLGYVSICAATIFLLTNVYYLAIPLLGRLVVALPIALYGSLEFHFGSIVTKCVFLAAILIVLFGGKMSREFWKFQRHST